MAVTIVLIVLGVGFAGFLVFWLIGERGSPMRGSTWRMMKENGLWNNLSFKSMHSYLYGRWTAWYVKRLMEKRLPKYDDRQKQRLADGYHSKVLTHELANSILTIERDIPLQDLEQIIPYAKARDLVLKGPPELVAYECSCRARKQSPCQPSMVCLVVGQPFVDFLLQHNPDRCRRLTQAEGLELLKQEHERGHLHSAWFKDAMLNRFYAICNCCKCCCGGIEAMVKFGAPTMLSSGYLAEVNGEECLACGDCQDVCPFNAIQATEDIAVIDREACMGCEICVSQCPNEAVKLVRDESKGLPLDVRAIAEKKGAQV